MIRSARPLPVFAFAAASLCVSAHAVPPNDYRVDVIGMGMTAFDMNDSGAIVGRQMNLLGVGRAFVAVRGAASQLLPIQAPWQSSDAYAISQNGVIVGAVSSSSIASVGSRAAAWYPNGAGYDFVLLPPIAGDTYSAAFGVNSAGDIVGGSGGLGLGSYPRAARFTAKGAILLNGIGTPADVNESRVVVSGNQLLDLDTMKIVTIPLPPGNWQGFVSSDISNAGNICGYILGFSGCSTFPLRYLPSAGWEYVGGCATTTSATSVNDLGDVTAFVASTSSWISFIGEDPVAPAAIIAPSQGSWLISGVGTMTNRREMTATGRLNGEATNQLLRLRPYKREDLNDDGSVNAQDLAALLAAWGDFGGPADLDGDGIVGSADIAVLLSAWTI
ncbi:MAG: hypothetical protein RIT24_1180 [Planctomycetota bacterium]